MKKIALLAAMALMMTGMAAAVPVTFSTTGVFSCFGGNSATCIASGSTIDLWIPTTSNFVTIGFGGNAGVTSGGSAQFGTFATSSPSPDPPQGVDPNGIFTLNISQTTPSVGTGSV